MKKTQTSKKKKKEEKKDNSAKNNAKYPCFGQNIKEKKHNRLYFKEKLGIFWRSQRSPCFGNSWSYQQTQVICQGFFF